ncbi:MAG: hypothetical protein DRI86_12135 [Bacteroidetes bacterium]|nr:MAG: hypothetical protein DRI86_12135 [Bacteroidota bacterium]
MSEKYKVVIVDDEGTETLSKIIQKFYKDLEVVGKAFTVKEAISIIEDTHPKLVFLDIKLPDGRGFDIFKKLKYSEFETIMTTAFDSYALEAYQNDALHYLVKPIDIFELDSAINKFYKVIKPQIVETRGSTKKSEKIKIPTVSKIEFIEKQNILKLESLGNNSTVFLINGKKIIASKILKYFEENLPNGFIRIHKQTIVNKEHIESYYYGRGGYVLLSDDSTATVSARLRADFLKEMNLEGEQ